MGSDAQRRLGVVASFEFWYQLRRPLVGLSMLVFFALGLGLAASEVGAALAGVSGTRVRNAPLVLLHLMPVLSLLGLFVLGAVVTSAALRDFEQRSDPLFFTKPLDRWDYLGGRFLGSMAVSFLVLLAGVAGLVAGHFAPWQPADRMGPFAPEPYFFGLVAIVVPNLLAMGALFFALATWSRRSTVTYLGVVFFIGMQDAVELAAQGLDHRWLGSLLEPSGIVALGTVSQYWTVAEQATRLPALGGVLLANRGLWLLGSLAILVLAISRFSLAAVERRARRPVPSRPGPSRPGPSRPAPSHGSSSSVVTPRSEGGVVEQACSSGEPVAPDRERFPGGLDRLRQLLGQARLEISEVVARAPFLALLAFGLMFTIAYALLVGMEEGMPPLPLTSLMLEAIGLGVRLSLVVILVVYAGELVASHRALGLSQVYDALPIPSSLLLGAKLLALGAIAVIFLGCATLSTLAIQLAKGFVPTDLGLYAQGAMVLGAPLVPLIVLAVFLQVLADQKVLGFLLTGLALLLRFALPRLGFEDNLYLLGEHPAIHYSAFNGYGHHLGSFAGFMTYWTLGAALLLLAAAWLWPRGTERTWRSRLGAAWERRSLGAGVVGGVLALAMVGVGLFLFDHTHRRSTFVDRKGQIERLADYERSYRRYADLPLPRVTRVFVEVDLFPDERRLEIRGRYRLENRGDAPIHTLPITLTPRWVEGALPVYGGVELVELEVGEHRRLIDDEALGFHVVELAEPLAVGAGLDLGFEVRVDHRAWPNEHQNDLVVANGTFFSNREFLPVLGYAASNQLQSPTERSKRGMSPVERAADLDDAKACQRNYLGADWIRFEAVISTSADQVALSTGDLVGEWTEGDRRFFHYRTDQPVTHLLPFVSGRYAVARDRWQGIDLEIYHHPEHDTNIEHFLEVTRRSLEYLTEHFGPYPHDQLRIVEIPSYHGRIAFAFAQVIPFSESWTFTADLEAADLDWLAAILAHEVAHQWWNHQVVPADVQGATLIAESLAQHSAMRILEAIHGPEMVRYFLRFHLDRYLEQRGREQIREMPLARVENQGYIHYSKASLVFDQLAHRIGETTLNRALRSLIESHGMAGPPYATSRDLLAELRAVAPVGEQALLEDLFETITLFDHRLDTATYRQRDDGRFEVELGITTRKLRDDGLGNTTEVAMDDLVEVVVFGEPDSPGASGGSPLVSEEHRLRSGSNTLTLVVDERPHRAGVDPYHRFVDRLADDNLRTLEERSRDTGTQGDP